MAAAYEAASRGYKVTIADEAWAVGGQLRQQTQVVDPPLPSPFDGLRGYELAGALVERLRGLPVEFLLQHEFTGLFADGSIGVNGGNGIRKIACHTLIVATGAAESALPFPGWTLPGVMTIGAAQILLNRERVYPGHTALVLGSSEIALEVAGQMQDAGISIMGVVEPGERIRTNNGRIAAEFGKKGIPLFLRTELTSVTGRDKVTKAILNKIDIPEISKELEVDLVCIDGGRHPILEAAAILNCQLKCRKELGGWLPAYSNNLQTTVDKVFVAGQAAGITCQAGVVLTGGIAGISAVDFIERRTTESRDTRRNEYWSELEQIEMDLSPETWLARVAHIG